MNSRLSRKKQLISRFYKLKSIQYQHLLTDISKQQSNLGQHKHLIDTLSHIINSSSASTVNIPLTAFQLKNLSQYQRQLTINLLNCISIRDQKQKDISELALKTQKKKQQLDRLKKLKP